MERFNILSFSLSLLYRGALRKRQAGGPLHSTPSGPLEGDLVALALPQAYGFRLTTVPLSALASETKPFFFTFTCWGRLPYLRSIVDLGAFCTQCMVKALMYIMLCNGA